MSSTSIFWSVYSETASISFFFLITQKTMFLKWKKPNPTSYLHLKILNLRAMNFSSWLKWYNSDHLSITVSVFHYPSRAVYHDTVVETMQLDIEMLYFMPQVCTYPISHLFLFINNSALAHWIQATSFQPFMSTYV